MKHLFFFGLIKIAFSQNIAYEMFQEYVEDIIENDELDITLEEINYLKEEYGLTEEVEN